MSHQRRHDQSFKEQSHVTLYIFAGPQGNKLTGKPVPDAVIFTTRLDMAPDGMASMATKIAPVPGAEPGTYRFKADVSMAGGWLLSLGAKVQGETGTVEGKLVFKASK